MLTGDRVERALTLIGITDRRISEWLGRDCGCGERKEKLNQLDLWARRVIRGKIDNAHNYLDRIIKGD